MLSHALKCCKIFLNCSNGKHKLNRAPYNRLLEIEIFSKSYNNPNCISLVVIQKSSYVIIGHYFTFLHLKGYSGHQYLQQFTQPFFIDVKLYCRRVNDLPQLDFKRHRWIILQQTIMLDNVITAEISIEALE